jgi:hypothetical protein
MARPSKEFLLAWSSLSNEDAQPGWRSISLPSAGPLDVRAGRRSPDNSEAVLVGFNIAKIPFADKLPNGNGFSVERIDLEGTGNLWIALSRNSTGNPELFTTMSCDVIGALDCAVATGADEAQLARVCIGRVGAWQEFMRKGTQALSPEAEIGLIGELALLSTIISLGVAAAQAIESWVGPLRGVQDFELGTGALEVKATLSAKSFPAKIGSLEQLNDAVRQPLFVAGARFRQIESGQNLPEFVAAMREEIQADVEAVRLFDERLLAAGYLDLHECRYSRKFTLNDIRVIKVGEEFPRLTPYNAPVGITWAIYEIDLDKVPGDSLRVEDALKQLGAI